MVKKIFLGSVVGFLVSSCWADDVNHFSFGGGYSDGAARVLGLPISMDKRTQGFTTNVGYYFADWVGVEFRWTEQEDLDFIISDEEGDFDLFRRDLLVNFSHYLGGGRFIVRGKVGGSRWKADGFMDDEQFDGSREIHFNTGGWEYNDEDYRRVGFEQDGYAPFVGAAIGFDLRRHVEFLWGYDYMKTDYFELNNLSFTINVRL